MARPSNAELPELLSSDSGVSERAGTVLDAGDVPPALDAGDVPPALDAHEVPPASELTDPLLGQVVSQRYRVDAVLGAGGMGCVYRATHVHMRSVVALKVLHRQMNLIPEAVARFEREAIAAARIQHPNVAAARDFGRLEDGSFYMALEFIEGTSLRDLMGEGVKLPVPRTVNIIRQIAEALDAAHAQGVVHRDLKPENVMLAEGGNDQVKVLDFGIAKVSGAKTDANQLTQLGSVFGTPDYMSPEQAAGQPVDHRSDLYTLGVLMYEMLTGEPPFSGDSIAIVLTKHMHEPAPDLPSSVDWRLADLTKRLLAKEPADRPASAHQVADELLRTRLSVVPVPPASRKWLAQLEKVKHVLGAVASALRPLLVPLWRLAGVGARAAHRLAAAGCDRLSARFPRLQVLDKRLPLGKHRVSLWSLIACCVALLVVVLLFSALSSGAEPQAGSEAEGAETATEEVAPDGEVAGGSKAAATLSKEQALELQDLLAIPVYKRKVSDWLSMGRIYRESKQWTETASAYRNAIQLEPKTAKDPTVLQAFRDAAVELDSYEAAINVAVNLLGEPGLDLVYDVWLETKGQRKKKEIAELAYKKLEILRLRRASEALRIRLDLEFLGNGDCDAIAKTVDAAKRHADRRSVEALTALESTSGCGASKKRDCFACLRSDDSLEQAIETAKGTPAPKFDGTKYVPTR